MAQTTGPHAISTPYVPELVFAVLQWIDPSAEGRKTLASCRRVCRYWREIIHPLAFPNAVISFKNEPTFDWWSGMGYQEWYRKTRDSLQHFILPLAQRGNGTMVKRLVLKGLYTSDNIKEWDRSLIQACVLCALVRELPNLEELTLYGCIVAACAHEAGCSFVSEACRPTPLRHLFLEGVTIAPSGQSESSRTLSKRKDYFSFHEFVDPVALRIERSRFSGEGTQVGMKVKARVLHWSRTDILELFERVEGLEEVQVARLQPSDQATLRTIILASLTTLQSVKISGTLGTCVGLLWPARCLIRLSEHLHEETSLGLKFCSRLEEASFMIDIEVSEESRSWFGVEAWDKMTSWVAQLPTRTANLQIHFNICVAQGGRVVGEFIRGGRWVEVVGAFLGQSRDREVCLRMSGIGRREGRRRAAWREFEKLPGLFQRAGFGGECRPCGF